MRHLKLLVLLGVLVVATACDKPLTVSTTSLPDAQVGVAYQQQLTGGNVDRWVLLSGVLPPGLSLSPGGLLKGTPTTVGVFVFTVQALQQPISAPTVSLDQGLSLTVR